MKTLTFHYDSKGIGCLADLFILLVISPCILKQPCSKRSQFPCNICKCSVITEIKRLEELSFFRHVGLDLFSLWNQKHGFFLEHNPWCRSHKCYSLGIWYSSDSPDNITSYITFLAFFVGRGNRKITTTQCHCSI